MVHFDRVHLINLDRRPDRLEKFWLRYPYAATTQARMPLPQRVSGLDGEKLGKPAWFSQQAGAWGCLRTHLQLIEQAINSGESIFIWEDDCVFAEGFGSRLAAFLDHVPDDWQMIYLGGLHRNPVDYPPIPVNDHVHLGRCITTTYAYGIRNTFLRELYHQLLNAEQHHIDQMLARLQAANLWRIYCPVPWLVGMDEGMSDICGRYYQKPHWWQYQPGKKEQPIHLLQLLSRKRFKNGVWSDVPLDSQQNRPKLTSTIGGWFSQECGEVYRRECRSAALRNKRNKCILVEVGSWRGRSLSYLADLILTGEVAVHAVDTWKGNSTPTDPTHGKDVFEDFRDNMTRLGIVDLMNVHRMPSVEASHLFEDDSLDLVMIDADHEYTHVYSDLESWWPKIKPGGLLMGHDYSPGCGCPEVVRAVDDWAMEHDLPVETDADMWLIRKPVLVQNREPILAGVN